MHEPKTTPTGDMDPETFRRYGHQIVDWIAEYFEHPERYPVLAQVQPGDVVRALPDSPPAAGESFDRILADFDRVIVPGITHWNHPGFFAYFAITGSGPGVLAELLSAALNAQGMLWRTSPSVTELEEVALCVAAPARSACRRPSRASSTTPPPSSSMHALAAAREAAVPGVRERGLAGRPELPPLRVYCSEHAHSSIDKGVICVGLGHARAAEDPGGRALPDAHRRFCSRPSPRTGHEDRPRSPSSRRSARHRRRASIPCRTLRTSAQRERAVAARGRRLRRRGGHRSRVSLHPRRLRPRRLARRQSRTSGCSRPST